jgi:hypothetical protein
MIGNTPKMIFAGCSFTYGHGLWHYTKEEGLPNNDTVIYYHEFPESLFFMEDNRFPRLVSNYFNSREVLKPTTSGNDETSLEFIRQLLSIGPISNTWTDERINYDEVSHLIFQTSYLDRCALYEDGEKMKIYDSKTNWKDGGKIIKDVEYFWNELKHFYYNKIKEMFIFLEEKNIKCYMLAITDDYWDLIQEDEYIKKRFIKLEYDGKSFNNYLDLFEYDKKLMIVNDIDNFDYPPKDFHPTLKCHKVVTDSIIKKLETDLS